MHAFQLPFKAWYGIVHILMGVSFVLMHIKLTACVRMWSVASIILPHSWILLLLQNSRRVLICSSMISVPCTCRILNACSDANKGYCFLVSSLCMPLLNGVFNDHILFMRLKRPSFLVIFVKFHLSTNLLQAFHSIHFFSTGATLCIWYICVRLIPPMCNICMNSYIMVENNINVHQEFFFFP